MALTRKTAEERTEELTVAAYAIAAAHGMKKVTRAAVARATDTSVGLTNRYFKDRDGLRDAALAYAVKQKDVATLSLAQVAGFELPSMTKVLAADVKRNVKAMQA
jgi:AcrR family transcriptional regulator